MSAIVGIFGDDADEAAARRMLGAMRARGADVAEVRAAPGAVLAVARHGWEAEPRFSGAPLVIEHDGLLLVADASLYHLDPLRRRLEAAGIARTGDAPGELILAAYRAWGERCAEQIEGDYAFVLWDGRARRALCGRDPCGMRPLHYAAFGETLVLASSIGGVLAHPRCAGELDLTRVALDAAGILFASDDRTSFQAVRTFPAGATGTREAGGPLRIRRWWDPPAAGAHRPWDEAAAELRARLGDAVEQRLDPREPTALWLSGGWDSSSILAVGRQRLGPDADRLRPVSVTYPEGDTGREDETIQAMAEHWNADVHWVDAAAIPPLDLSEARAAARDEPFAFFFTDWMRHVAGETRAAGPRTVLTGHGGNFLFASSAVFLADLLARGRLRTLWREWRAMGARQGRAAHLFRWAVQPLLPLPLLRAIERVRRRPLLGTYERELPGWLDPEFVAQHGLAERARDATPRARSGSRSGHELRWFMTHPFFPRVNALAFQATLGAGVEQRAPLYDRALVCFAAAGPWYERYSRAGSKRLLRHAMRGLLPPSVLADRQGRAGTLESYVEGSIDLQMSQLYRIFDTPALAELGIARPGALAQLLERYRRDREPGLADQILTAAHVESWLRTHGHTRRSGLAPELQMAGMTGGPPE